MLGCNMSFPDLRRNSPKLFSVGAEAMIFHAKFLLTNVRTHKLMSLQWHGNNREANGNDAKTASKELYCMSSPGPHNKLRHTNLWHHLILSVRTEERDKVASVSTCDGFKELMVTAFFSGGRGIKETKSGMRQWTQCGRQFIFFLVQHPCPPSLTVALVLALRPHFPYSGHSSALWPQKWHFQPVP